MLKYFKFGLVYLSLFFASLGFGQSKLEHVKNLETASGFFNGDSVSFRRDLFRIVGGNSNGDKVGIDALVF